MTTRTSKKATEQHIDRETMRGLENLPVPVLELGKIARIAREAFARGEDIAAAVRAYALTITTATGGTQV